MKYLSYLALLSGANADGIAADADCKNDRTNCEYNLKCNGPMVDIKEMTNVKYLCVEFPICLNPKITYTPETGGPGVEGVEFQ